MINYCDTLVEYHSFTEQKSFRSHELNWILCVQKVVTPIYIMSYYINWGNYFLGTRYDISYNGLIIIMGKKSRYITWLV